MLIAQEALLRERLPEYRANGAFRFGVVDANLVVAEERQRVACEGLLAQAPIEVEQQDRRKSRREAAHDALPPSRKLGRDRLLPGRSGAARVVKREDAHIQLRILDAHRAAPALESARWGEDAANVVGCDTARAEANADACGQVRVSRGRCPPMESPKTNDASSW